MAAPRLAAPGQARGGAATGPPRARGAPELHPGAGAPALWPSSGSELLGKPQGALPQGSNHIPCSVPYPTAQPPASAARLGLPYASLLQALANGLTAHPQALASPMSAQPQVCRPPAACLIWSTAGCARMSCLWTLLPGPTIESVKCSSSDLRLDL